MALPTFHLSSMILTPHTIVIGFSVLVLYLSFKFYCRRSRIGMIRGPPSPSWLLGHLYMLRHTKNVGDYEAAWYRDYGSVFRIAGVFSEPVLLVSDPKALQYIFHASGYQFAKSVDTNRLIEAIFGRGLVTAVDKDHQRQRKILNPAFSAVHLRSYLDVFQASGCKLVDRLKETLNEGDEVQNMLSWTQKVALDIVGITSFRYSFGALDNMKSALEEVMCNFFSGAQYSPSALDVFLFQGGLCYLPESFMTILAKIPTKESQKYQGFRSAMEKHARSIYNRELQLVKDSSGAEQDKDIINILAQSSLSDDKNRRMSENEIVSQMATFILAGHDTTAHSLAWLLYELSLHPEDQDRIRQEILHARSRTTVLTSSDYDAMIWLNASIKETLRLHPFVHTLIRVAQQDDKIPISKGQSIQASVYMYNRNPIVWGDDVDKWNPNRFLDGDHREATVGVFSNLLTFSSGVRACIGWRFAVMEIQVICVELLSSFEFSLPEDASAVIHGSGTITLFPLLKDRPEDGIQLPLRVSSLKQKA
ncbi:PAH-inducible cytochrome P450 monooxygenase PC-PAH 1 [Hymenopellis radicata]|nr:PAH-inducible cytochrome P450 monooxygenase PC-PAH 1 [Hymenopellis radicata]